MKAKSKDQYNFTRDGGDEDGRGWRRRKGRERGERVEVTSGGVSLGISLRMSTHLFSGIALTFSVVSSSWR